MQRSHGTPWWVAALASVMLISAGCLGNAARSLPSTPATQAFVTPAVNMGLTGTPAGEVWATRAVPPTPPGTPRPAGAMRAYTDGMTGIYVPAGEFLMGTSNPAWLEWPDEIPQRTIYLDAFWIDSTEVTNGMYARCVQAGACSAPTLQRSYTRESYFGNPQFANYPVIHVSWDAAQRYCRWAGRRLPSEAEWEKAARGPDGRHYPWGNEPPDGRRGNVDDSGDTSPVGSYPAGASPYGALDMAGNVWEWVEDLYQSDYYKNVPNHNPPGPPYGNFRVVRGGQWSVAQRSALANDRYGYGYRATEDRTGIRCAAWP